MPTAQHPQAKFDPIPPDFDLHSVVERTPNFHWILRISAAQIRNIGPQEFERLVFLHVIHGGKPLVIEKWNDRLPKSLFSAQWLESTYDKKPENVRDVVGQADIPMSMGHYLRSMKTLTNQWAPSNFRDERRQRLYLKDIDCPPEWQEYLQKIIPPNLYYMNSNVDERAGKGSGDDMGIFQEGRSAAPAGDLMSSLPEEMRAQNLMCYIGHEGTYTPAHREMCASLGQNIMVDASGDENGERPGSSIWFMTETKDREVVREYFLSMLGHDIEIEKHFAQVNAWKKATFPVYVVEQKVGDFILVPPLAPHQVWNRGTRTIKVAWNRTTAETLQLALHEALPKARLVCRDEQYKNKAIIFYTLDKYYKEMVDTEKTADIGLLGFGQDLIKNSTRMKQMAADFKSLFSLFTEVLLDEMFATREKEIDYIEFDSNITCSYCRANIFNRFLTCKRCVRQLVNGDEDTYDICMECYVMGRSCFCVSNLSWCEQWHWSDLVDRYESWRALIIKNDGFVSFDGSPLPLELARRKLGKKAVAQICQEQLRMRPWKDITQAKEASEPESDVEVDDEGRPKKKKKRKAKKGDVHRCHVCQHKDYNYKLAFCTNEGCHDAYCFGVLYRAFDMMPQEVVQNERWQCPKCLKICNCAACRRAGNGVPYIPKTTLLGHDTRRIADDRSVETLVDFRVHNLSWLKSVGDESRSLSSKRMQRLQQAAEAEKAKQAEMPDTVPTLPDGALAEQNGYHMGPAAVTDMSTGVTQDQSSYPDPSGLGRERMLGMGYYEQDDSPDKILFDPYQMPSTEALVVDDEPEISKYHKKQPRITKRRARQEEDDDPDFQGPCSHHRKKPRLEPEPQPDAQEVALSNMDPALFGGDETVLDAPTEEAPPVHPEAPAEVSQPAPEPADGAQDTSELSGTQSATPNREPEKPAKRRGRPPKVRPSLSAGPENETDDLDAQLAQQLKGLDEEGEVINTEVAPRDETAGPVGPRRRGRPPRNAQPEARSKKPEVAVELPSQSLLSMAERMRLRGKKFRIGQPKGSASANPKTTTRSRESEGESTPVEAEHRPAERLPPQKEATPKPVARGRGRPRKQATRDETESAGDDFDPAAEEEAVSDTARSPSPLVHAEPKPVLEADPEPSPPPSISATPPLAPSMAVQESLASPFPEQEEPGPGPDQEVESEPSPAVETTPSPAPSPPAEPTPTPEPSAPAEATPTSEPSLPITPSPVPESSLPIEHSPVPEPSPPPSPPRLPSGPTIVRLLDSDEEDDYYDGGGGGYSTDGEGASRSGSEHGGEAGSEVGSDGLSGALEPSDSDEDEDEDIPARPSLASRGRGAAVRGTPGVGRGRPRGRGRGRGVAV
ncbi:hypothetical protein CHGG_08009 [Chaetomium globosum CBS 148.51]|uniref:JmjC domain-containing protein n=1 Tax=Chaetomium globosum (strain ATCC 6205 / CBS 148.51 / DSM 1962 / NBRC 6347 / NRRL 1970) TaxID=306901 RepID=Q2GVJ5_CHAGB|nr:uncharacterized protein CHGG_08009 [Chaetomium globosum CBS 148.51]EAQ86756.1 hypothetical protein CHGG_08009 [Chaetomium globosum CBS 148.51]